MKLESQFELAKWRQLAPLLERKDLEEMVFMLLEQHLLLEEKIKELPFMFSELDYGTTTDDGGNGVEDLRGIYDAWGIVLPQG